jgi:hypothetical protein
MSPSTQAPSDDLQLKAGPRPVTRINRRLLILVAAILLAGIVLLVLIAFHLIAPALVAERPAGSGDGRDEAGDRQANRAAPEL